MGGGGADGAVHRVAGPALTEACEAFPVREKRGPKGYEVRIETGEVVLTKSFGLPATD